VSSSAEGREGRNLPTPSDLGQGRTVEKRKRQERSGENLLYTDPLTILEKPYPAKKRIAKKKLPHRRSTLRKKFLLLIFMVTSARGA